METINLAVGLASLIFGGFALWLAVYFYNQSKNTETRVQTALEGIRTQTDILQTLNTQIMNRLVKSVTTPRDESSQTTNVLAVIRDLPDIVRQLSFPSNASNEAILRREIVSAYLVMWYYIGMANLYIATHLPTPDEFDENNPNHRSVKHRLDTSAADFRDMASVIGDISQDDIRNSPQFGFYTATERLIDLVGDTAHHFVRNSQIYSP